MKNIEAMGFYAFFFWKTIANLDVKPFGRAFIQYAFWSYTDDF